jgi:glycosyltransferase involved in cell wall biosynthesis
MQCDALKQQTDELVLYAKRTLPEIEKLQSVMDSTYGQKLREVRLVTFWSRFNHGDNLRIALLSIWDLLKNEWPDVIMSRNLYASFVIAVILRRPILFETHQLEHGFRKRFQRIIMLKPWVITVVISNMLKQFLREHHGIDAARAIVLHDAAPSMVEPIPVGKRRTSLVEIVPQAKGSWDGVCGYFGHLYSGRGVEIIEDMASVRPGVLFLLFGGNEADVEYRRESNKKSNVIYVGYVTHPVAQKAMKSVDVLLMPYQKSVSIGLPGHDTARWMSPMKMFEYMSAGVPIISSDLPVLREVLEHKKNALLVHPEKSDEWVLALDFLLNDSSFANHLGSCAHNDYKNKHTWVIRAKHILEAAASL